MLGAGCAEQIVQERSTAARTDSHIVSPSSRVLGVSKKYGVSAKRFREARPI